MTQALVRRPPALLAALAIAGLACGGDLTLPDSSGAGLDLDIVGGNGQTGPVGEALPDPLVVRVLAPGGQPVAGRMIAFVLPDGATGRTDPDTAVTNSSGQALARWVLGTQPGNQDLEARLVSEIENPPAARFEASAVAAAPDTIRALTPLSQPGRRGETLEESPVVLVVDRFGNPVAGVEVTWAVTAGGGTASDDSTPTGGDGTASVSWTLGGRIGVHKLEASVPGATGSPVTFSAIVLF